MSSKRILLMYISEVSGHHSATIAIEKALLSLNPSCSILNINAFNYTNPISEKVINRIYMGVIKRTPQLWERVYDNPKVVKSLERLKQYVHKSNAHKLKKLFDQFKPDAVVCTQAFPCGMVADYKKYCNSSLPLVAVLTDYVPHAFWLYDTIDYYICPSDDVGQRLEARGVPRSKIKPFGIPFNHLFNRPLERLKVLGKLGLDPEKPVILIMGGGHGLGPIKEVVNSLEKVRIPLQEIIVTGVNKRLYRSLHKTTGKLKNKILLYGFSDKINELMCAADMIISKPGGVTTAEVLSKGVAMIIVQPIPGQEMKNTEFLTQKGAAVELDDPREINYLVEDMLNHPEKLKRLREGAQAIAKPDASLNIAKLLLNIPNV